MANFSQPCLCFFTSEDRSGEEFLTDKSQNHEKRIHIIVKKMKVTLFVYPVVFSSKQEEIFSNPNLLQVGRKLQLLITAF